MFTYMYCWLIASIKYILNQECVTTRLFDACTNTDRKLHPLLPSERQITHPKRNASFLWNVTPDCQTICIHFNTVNSTCKNYNLNSWYTMCVYDAYLMILPSLLILTFWMTCAICWILQERKTN